VGHVKSGLFSLYSALQGILRPKVGVEVFVALPDVPVAVDDSCHHGLGGGSSSGGDHSFPRDCVGGGAPV
jgi:hypothetical protein